MAKLRKGKKGRGPCIKAYFEQLIQQAATDTDRPEIQVAHEYLGSF